MVTCDLCVGLVHRIKTSLKLLSICTNKLLSATKRTPFFPMLPSVNENSERESHPMLWLLYLYLSGSAFLVRSTDPNEQIFHVKSVLEFPNHRLRI